MRKNPICQGLDLQAIQPDRAGPLQGLDEAIEDRVDDEDLLLRDTKDVVVEGGSFDDPLGGRIRTGGFVHQNGGVARAGRDHLFAGTEGRFYQCRPAGRRNQSHVRMGEEPTDGLHRRLPNHADQVGGAAGLPNGAAKDLHCACRDLLRGRMNAEYGRVARRRDDDDAVEHHRNGMRRRRDGGDDPVGSVLFHTEPLVAGKDPWLEVFETRRCVGGDMMFDDLVFDPPHAGLLLGQSGELLGVLVHGPTQSGNHCGTVGAR